MEAQKPVKSFLYDTLLPKIEWLSWPIAAWGFIAGWYQIVGWASWLIVGIGNLSIASYLSAFAPRKTLITDEPYFGPIVRQNQHNQFITADDDSFLLNSLAPKVAGIAGSVVLVGTLFKMMFWTGHRTMLIVGTGSMVIVVLIMALNQRRNMRAFILTILGGVMLYVPSETLMRELHRDDPKLVELMIYQEHHPHDRAAVEAIRIHIKQKRAQR